MASGRSLYLCKISIVRSRVHCIFIVLKKFFFYTKVLVFGMQYALTSHCTALYLGADSILKYIQDFKTC